MVNGTKFYSTGSLAGDEAYINGVSPETGEILLACVPMDAEGVTVVDDWAAMGQRTTANGTTQFDNVRISADRISPTALHNCRHSRLTIYAEHLLLTDYRLMKNQRDRPLPRREQPLAGRRYGLFRF